MWEDLDGESEEIPWSPDMGCGPSDRRGPQGVAPSPGLLAPPCCRPSCEGQTSREAVSSQGTASPPAFPTWILLLPARGQLAGGPGPLECCPYPALGLSGHATPSCFPRLAGAGCPSAQSRLTETQKYVWNLIRGEPPAYCQAWWRRNCVNSCLERGVARGPWGWWGGGHPHGRLENKVAL